MKALRLLFLSGVVSALLGYGQDDEEEEAQGGRQWKDTPEWERQNRFGFRIGDYSVGVPVRGFSRVAYYLGHKVVDIFAGNDTVVDSAGKMTSFLAENMIEPMGNTANMVQTLTPSIFRPIAELAQNQTFSGRQVYREPFGGNENQVRSQMGRGNTGAIFKTVAQVLNSISGGTKVERGAIDYQPEIYEHVWNAIAGTTGRDLAQTGDLAVNLVKFVFGNPDFSLKTTPFVNRFVHNISENSASFRKAQTEYAGKIDALNKADNDSDVADIIASTPYLDPRNRRWGDELKELNSAAKNLMKHEMRAETPEERDAIHQLRLRVQYAFMKRMAEPPKEADADTNRRVKTIESDIRKPMRDFKREDRKERREKERKRRRGHL